MTILSSVCKSSHSNSSEITAEGATPLRTLEGLPDPRIQCHIQAYSTVQDTKAFFSLMAVGPAPGKS